MTLAERAKAGAQARWLRDKLPVPDRFWSNVDQVTEDECWEWIGYRNKGGYGVFNLEHRHHGETGVRVLAPRMAWQLTNGPIPQGKYVLHKCDNPPCVNPKHLWIGSIADNQRDMAEKGRGNAPRILTKEQVLEIRAKYVKGQYGYIRLGKEYGVHHNTIVDIIKRRNWKRV